MGMKRSPLFKGTV